MTAAAFPDGLDLDVGFASRRFDDSDVESARQLVARSHLVDDLTGWRVEERARLERHPGGRPELFPPEALLVAMMLAAVHDVPMLATAVLGILFQGISTTMRDRLGIPEPPAAGDDLGWDAAYRCVRTRLHSLLRAVDPSPLPKNRRSDAETFNARVANFISENKIDEDVLEKRHERLARIVNNIIEASLSVMNRELRRRWDGSVAVDATHIPAFAHQDVRRAGRGPRESRPVIRHSTDPDAGLYTRTSMSTKGPPKLRDFCWAYEATLVVSGCADPEKDPAFPSLVVGMAPLHRPGTEVGANAIIALASIKQRGHPTAWLAGDRAYSNTKPEKFQLPARALGYDPIFDYRVDQLGVSGSHAGALLIEGTWYCPAIPAALTNATADYRSRKITEATYRNRIKARENYALRPKERPDEEDHVRLMCPAAPGAPRAECELKPASVQRTSSGRLQIPVTDELRIATPTICRQSSVVFPPDAGAKLRQTMPYASPPWETRYHSLRNGVEGINGTAKDGAHAALGDPTRRRIRGVAAQSLITAMLLAAVNIRKIAKFIQTLNVDPDGRERRRRARRRSTAPLSEWSPHEGTTAAPAPP